MAHPSNPLDDRLLDEDANDLYDHAPCGYMSTTLDGVVVKVNDTFLNWTGYARDDLLAGRRFTELLSVGGRIFYETHFAPLLRMQGFVREIAFDVACRDGRVLPVLVNATVKSDPAGRPALVRTTIFDATDRRRYERELLLARDKAERASRMKDDFVSMVSHDMRAPLSAIVTAVQLLEKFGESDRQQRFLRILRSSSDHLLNLVNNLLDLSRLEAGRAPLEQRPFDLRAMLNDIVASVGVRADAKQLPVRLELDDRMPAELLGDPLKLGQVVTNLLTNAVKFTERGFVTCRVAVHEMQPDSVTLDFVVSDTGIGIPQDRLAEIFEEFTQASEDIRTRYGGSGLGLAISRRLLRLHDSDLSVSSVLGQGSTFSFRIRLKRSPA